MSTPEPTRMMRRLATRRALGAGDVPPEALMTEEDEDNLTVFEADVAAVTEVLEEEVAAIRAGRIDAVTDLYPRKAELLKRIELLMPVVEPFLRARIESDAALHARLGALKAAVEADGALLERISGATTTIVREIDKIRDRHSLNGLYSKRGERVGDPSAPRRGIDKTL